MQITVNETEMKIEDGKLIININSELEKILNVNRKTLSSVDVGHVINNKYIVLEHFDDGTTAVIRKELLEEEMSFGDTNDWRSSRIRTKLNRDYLEEIENEFCKYNIVEHDVNLLSLDGLDDYGVTRDKVSLFNIDQYRKYRKVFGKNMGSWWWLLTPDSTPSGESSRYVQCVIDGGVVLCSDCDDGMGVRPFFVLKSDILVSEEE